MIDMQYKYNRHRDFAQFVGVSRHGTLTGLRKNQFWRISLERKSDMEGKVRLGGKSKIWRRKSDLEGKVRFGGKSQIWREKSDFEGKGRFKGKSRISLIYACGRIYVN
jgi:hypothetical protein